MSHRILNFSAGPAILPEPVLAEAAEGVRELQGSGMSILEVSHRGKHYEAIHADAEARLLKVLGLNAEDYAALFMQGGASQQFAQVPQNFLKPGQTADYVVSGDWGAKALKEAKYYGDAREAASSKGENYSELPLNFTRTPGARYVHITTNNTIEGTEYFSLPDVGDTPLVADMSSDYLALRRDYAKFALMYGGAQKNVGPAGVTLVVARKSFLAEGNQDIPKIYSYGTFLENRSLYNTPPTFAVYVVGLILKWIEAEGGLEAIEARNKRKAAVLYNALDELTPFYQPTVTNKNDRSLMNVTWRLRDEALEPELLAEFKKADMDGLKGHRSVGGFRASIYNAFPEKGVQALADLLRDFAGAEGLTQRRHKIMSNGKWSPMEDGATVGQVGSENGVILLDEEHSYGARITLEEGGAFGPFSITCGVYGVMVHTRFFGGEAEGRQAYEAMKLGLASIVEGEAVDAPDAASVFVNQFP